MFINALMQMATCETNITYIAQVTFKFLNKTLLVHNRWLSFAQFKILFDLVADKYRLDICTNLLTQVFKEARNSFFGLGVYLFKSKFRIEDKLRFP